MVAYASDEQMAAIRGGGRPDSYEWVDLPVGPQPIPTWCRGLTIDWMDGWANPPRYTIKVDKDFRANEWPGKAYRVEGHRYLAESGDGRASCFYHGGPLALRQMGHRVHSLVGMMPAGGPFNTHAVKWGTSRAAYWQAKYHWDAPATVWATTQDDGYGGQVFWIPLEDGRTVGLCGPWHGPAPAGYQDAGTSRHEALLVHDDLLTLLIARYYPHCRAARVAGRVQAVREDWDEPKAWMDAKRRAR